MLILKSFGQSEKKIKKKYLKILLSLPTNLYHFTKNCIGTILSPNFVKFHQKLVKLKIKQEIILYIYFLNKRNIKNIEQNINLMNLL